MKEIQQLIKKDSAEGTYKDIYPETFTSAVTDRETGKALSELLSIYNFYYLPYLGSDSETRLTILRKYRRKGLWIQYIRFDNTFQVEYYVADDIEDAAWGLDSNWQQYNSATLGPDDINEEDLAIVDNPNPKLQFADRPYNPANFSGKGYTILRKNIQDGKNILTQDMVSAGNTVYHIRYDYDLNGTTITPGPGSILVFQGGSVTNGGFNIIGNWSIQAPRYHIFKYPFQLNNCRWICDIEWFGGLPNSTVDNSPVVANALSIIKGSSSRCMGGIKFNEGSYRFSSPIVISEATGVSIVGAGEDKTFLSHVPISKETNETGKFIILYDVLDSTIGDFTVACSNQTHAIYLAGDEGAIQNNRFKPITVNTQMGTGYALYLTDGSGSTPDKVTIEANRFESIKTINNSYGLYVNTLGLGNVIDNWIEIYPKNEDNRGNTTLTFLQGIISLGHVVSNSRRVIRLSEFNHQFINIGSIIANTPLSFIVYERREGDGIKKGVLHIGNASILSAESQIINLAFIYPTDLVIDSWVLQGDITLRVMNTAPNTQDLPKFVIGNLVNLLDNRAGFIVDSTNLTYINKGDSTVAYPSREGVNFQTLNRSSRTSLGPANIAFCTNGVKDFQVSQIPNVESAGQITVKDSAGAQSPVATFNSNTYKVKSLGLDTFEVNAGMLGDVGGDAIVYRTNDDIRVVTGTSGSFKTRILASVKNVGTTAQRPVLNADEVYLGFQYWDTDLGKYIVWNGTTWVNPDGTKLAPTRGTTAQRPVLEPGDYGFIYYDTSLQTLAVWTGTEWKECCNGGSTPPEDPYVLLSKESMTFTSEGGTETIDVTSSSNWEITIS